MQKKQEELRIAEMGRGRCARVEAWFEMRTTHESMSVASDTDEDNS